MRTKGSCRFEAYYKIERFDDRIGAWRPIQKAFPDLKSAKEFAGKTGYRDQRFLKISELGMEVLP
jgi:hypothetical protein